MLLDATCLQPSFNGSTFDGSVMRSEMMGQRREYHVVYADGDEEDLDAEQLKDVLVPEGAAYVCCKRQWGTRPERHWWRNVPWRWQHTQTFAQAASAGCAEVAHRVGGGGGGKLPVCR